MSSLGSAAGGMSTVALDVGGANLKLADGQNYARTCSFPLWKQYRALPGAIRRLLDDAPEHRAVAVTMTGELADCFSTKQQGVSYILDSVRRAAGRCPVSVYLTDGRLVSLDEALMAPLCAAASNWHVLAWFAAWSAAPHSGCLIDIGSTTCDIIPFSDGRVTSTGYDDVGRLMSGELVYTGVGRTPVCALARTAEYRGRNCPLAKELFAMTQDVYLSLDELPEQPHDSDTADGRPATKSAARTRLARMFCVDSSYFTDGDACIFATQVAQVQLDEICAAVTRVILPMLTEPTAFVVSGIGEFLARRVVARMNSAAQVMSFADQYGAAVSRCATAYALARLANGKPSDEL